MSKTIDDLGIGPYTQFEEGKRLDDDTLLSESKKVATGLTTDNFQSTLREQHRALFNLDLPAPSWGDTDMPENFNKQAKRLFTFQLGPKFGPDEVLDMQEGRIDGMCETELVRIRDAATPSTKSLSQEVERESATLTTLMQEIRDKNTILREANGERFRYGKG